MTNPGIRKQKDQQPPAPRGNRVANRNDSVGGLVHVRLLWRIDPDLSSEGEHHLLRATPSSRILTCKASKNHESRGRPKRPCLLALTGSCVSPFDALSAAVRLDHFLRTRLLTPLRCLSPCATQDHCRQNSPKRRSASRQTPPKLRWRASQSNPTPLRNAG